MAAGLRAMLAAAVTFATVSPAPAPAEGWSAMFFGGQFFDNRWRDFFVRPGDLETVDSWLVGVAASREIARWPASLQWEIEGQVVRHFGVQDHWEVNLPVIMRWDRFPWDEAVRTGVAFGIGPSYAIDEPKAELERSGGTSRFLLYWMIEAEVAAPESDWSVVLRLHHRSTGYGVFGEAGGSNVLALGLRREF